MIETRDALVHDRPFIVQAQLAMALETERLTLVPETVRRGVEFMFDHPDRGFYLVAEQGGQTVGCMLVLKEWSDWRDGDVFWLHSVYVVPDARRVGTFRSLYAEVTRRAQAAGARGLRLYVDKTNARAMAAYRALGMSNQHYSLFETMF